nr:MAG TPA: hypothetical protein [Caudoviricetes sp.]DAH97425.1 MAG TPA: hypothetical protein [Bacteriophage sp.]
MITLIVRSFLIAVLFIAIQIVSLDHWLAFLSHYSICILYCGTDSS